MKKIFWHFSDYEIKKDVILMDRVVIGTHFNGVKSYGIEFYFEGGTVGFSSFIKRWVVANDFSEKIKRRGKMEGVCLRFGSPVINIYFSKRLAAKALQAIMKYKIEF